MANESQNSISTSDIVAALQQHGCDPQSDGDGYRAKCPCHDGKTHNSLAISADGKMYCHSCEANTGDVLKAIGLAEVRPQQGRKPKVTIDGKEVTLHDSEQSAIDGVTWSVFQKRGSEQRAPDRVHRYHDGDGNHIGTVLLWKFENGDKETRQIRRHESGWISKGMVAPRPLYHLPELMAANNVVICEGEKSADALRVIGIPATTPTQGAKSPKKSDWSVLEGKAVTISVDNDQAGREFGKLVLDLIRDMAVDVRVVELKDDWPELPEKGDAADWVEQFADINSRELRQRFDALPDHRETIDAIVLKRKQRTDSTFRDRTKIELSLDEKSVNDLVIQALAERGDIYDHSGCLAVIVDEQIPGEPQRKIIQHLSLASLRELISETVLFFTISEGKDGNLVEKLQRVPRWCYEAILVRGYWQDIPTIRGIVTSPVLRADGSILQTQGYDIDSGLYVDLTETFPLIDEQPTADDVQRAVDMLFDIVVDFPFKDAASKSAWLASLFTPLAREAYRGCTGPMFLFDANVRGSGKSLLGDINSLIVTGRDATRLSSPKDDDEARKRITALVMNDDQIVMIDNITGRFGCASLDAALTGTTWKDRRLGHTEMVEAPLRMAFYASGNNVILAADTARRVCHIRLESPLENPEDRDGFKYPDIRKHVRQNRPALLAAALTVLRGFIAAGSTSQKLKPWGSFEGWSDLVRGSIVWSGNVDPGETRTELRATSDSEAGALRQMLVAVAHVDPESHGLRTSDLLKITTGKDLSYERDDAEVLRDAVEMFCDCTIERLSSQKLGTRLSHFRNRVVDQMAFDCTIRRGANFWFVVQSGGRGVCGGPVSTNSYTRFSLVDTDSANEKHIPDPGENTSTTSTTSTPEPSDADIEWLTDGEF
jgi:hypothetical protein